VTQSVFFDCKKSYRNTNKRSVLFRIDVFHTLILSTGSNR